MTGKAANEVHSPFSIDPIRQSAPVADWPGRVFMAGRCEGVVDLLEFDRPTDYSAMAASVYMARLTQPGVEPTFDSLCFATWKTPVALDER